MRIYARFAQPILVIFFFTSWVMPQQRLLLVGGGIRPKEATRQFVEWAGNDKATILIITWASGVPEESFEAARKDFDEFKTASIENAPIAPLDPTKRERLLSQLKSATGIFFTGGDQNRIMDVLKDEELLTLLKQRYASGTPFGGTSAGEAVMSDPMMTGDADLTILNGSKVGTRKGLGLLPDAILDQHFIKRQRQNRLFGLIMLHPEMLGVGIDENTALLVRDNRSAKVVGETHVMFVDGRSRKGAFLVHILKSGDVFDLKRRKPVAGAGS